MSSTPSQVTLTLVLYLILFATLHSFLASLWFKRWTRRVLGPKVDRGYRLGYNLFAALLIVPLLYGLYIFPGEVLYVVPSPWRWILIAGQGLASLGFIKTFLETDPFQFLGIKPHKRGALVVTGFYCRVRNPLFLFALMFLWLTPFMTTNLFALYLIATIYFYLGAIHEEKRLVAEFGDTYREYQRQVPMIIPRLRCHTKSQP